jgi:hypothetical protein
MTNDILSRVDLGGGRPAEIGIFTPEGSAPLVVLDCDQWPMRPEAARRLAEALTAAADRAKELG